jgi:hypothetical protein
MDPQQQQQWQQFGFAFIGIIMIVVVIVYALTIWMYWRTLAKAGLAGPLAFLFLVPAIGPLIPLAILAFSDWKVVPAPTASPYYPPSYPPPPPPPPPAFQPPPQA